MSYFWVHNSIYLWLWLQLCRDLILSKFCLFSLVHERQKNKNKRFMHQLLHIYIFLFWKNKQKTNITNEKRITRCTRLLNFYLFITFLKVLKRTTVCLKCVRMSSWKVEWILNSMLPTFFFMIFWPLHFRYFLFISFELFVVGLYKNAILWIKIKIILKQIKSLPIFFISTLTDELI